MGSDADRVEAGRRLDCLAVRLLRQLIEYWVKGARYWDVEGKVKIPRRVGLLFSELLFSS